MSQITYHSSLARSRKTTSQCFQFHCGLRLSRCLVAGGAPTSCLVGREPMKRFNRQPRALITAQILGFWNDIPVVACHQLPKFSGLAGCLVLKSSAVQAEPIHSCYRTIVAPSGCGKVPEYLQQCCLLGIYLVVGNELSQCML